MKKKKRSREEMHRRYIWKKCDVMMAAEIPRPNPVFIIFAFITKSTVKVNVIARKIFEKRVA